MGNKRYRHGYQGQYAEHDAETGWENFELRLYNSRVGRWLSYDPEGQFNSPYVGMGNNPVSGIDPNGGFSGPGPTFFSSLKALSERITEGIAIQALDGFTVLSDVAVKSKFGFSLGDRLLFGAIRSLEQTQTSKHFSGRKAEESLHRQQQQNYMTLTARDAGIQDPVKRQIAFWKDKREAFPLHPQPILAVDLFSSLIVGGGGALAGERFYSVAFEMELPANLYPEKLHDVHF